MASSSESDLSDVPDNATFTNAPPHTSEHPSLSDDDVGAAASVVSEDVDVDMRSDDDDFQVDSPPRSFSAVRESRSGSEESRRPPKRKVGGIEDDEEIMNNPELYGIRRSVRIPLSWT